MIDTAMSTSTDRRHTSPDRTGERWFEGVDRVERSGRVKRESLDPELHGELAYGESVDGDHHPTAGRTCRPGHTGGHVVNGGRRRRRWRHTERVPAAWQRLGAVARR